MTSVHLKRELHFWDSMAITVGIVIGVGIFRTPSEIARYLDSPSLILAAWILGGLISLMGVFCYAELSSRFPETGGTYVFLREAFGKLVGFVYGWSEFSINRAASIAAVAYVFATYLCHLLRFSSEHEKWIALAAIVFLTAMNTAGLRLGIRIQGVLSSLKVVIILAIVGLIFWFAKAPVSTGSFFPADLGPLTGIAPAMIPILWSYGGWHESTFMSGEFRDTRRELPIALIASALTVTGLYVLINAAYLWVMPPAEMVGSRAIASDVLRKLLGQTGMGVITIAILISAFGALNSNILTGGRIPFAVAQDHPRLKWLQAVHPRFNTPHRSLALNGAWAAVLVLWGNFERLLFFTAFELWFFFILVGLSVFVLRRRASPIRSFSMIGYPLVPILFVVVSSWLFWTTIVYAPREACFGAFLISIGVLIYFLLNRVPFGRDKSVV